MLFLFCSCVFIQGHTKIALSSGVTVTVFGGRSKAHKGNHIDGIVGVKKSCFSIFYQFTFPFLMGNLSLTLSYGHSPQPYHCVCPLQIVVKSCSVHLKWISTYSRLGMTKYSNLSEITPQASTPMDWKRSIALKGIINEACSQTIYINTLFIDS